MAPLTREEFSWIMQVLKGINERWPELTNMEALYLSLPDDLKSILIGYEFEEAMEFLVHCVEESEK